MTDQDDHGKDVVTREWLELRMTAMRSELRLLVLIGLVGNQTLSHIDLPPAVGYVGGITFIGLAVLKLASLARVV